MCPNLSLYIMIMCVMCASVVVTRTENLRGIRIITIFGGGRYWSTEHQKIPENYTSSA